MTTFFPAGGLNADAGPWWRVLHSSLEAGADLSVLRLLHAVGAAPMTEGHCRQLEAALTPNVACVRYDPSSLLVIEPGVADHELIVAAETVLNVTGEQLRLWEAVGIRDDGLEFIPLDIDAIERASHKKHLTHAHDSIVLTDAEFTYFPMWDVQESEIFGYTCENLWNAGEGGYYSEDALEAFFAKHRHVYALDKEALHKAVTQAQSFLDRYIFTNLIIPVHYSTLADPTYADAYIEACNEGVWTVHDNVIFEITRVPVDMDGDTLFRAIDRLTPYGEGVWLRLNHDFVDFAAIPADAIASIGIGFQYDPRARDDIWAELETFVQATQHLNIARHAHGLEDMDSCITAVNLGYAYISSAAIAPPLDASQPEEMAQPSDVLKAMLKG